MTNANEVKKMRYALSGLPSGTSHGETPGLGNVYLPQSHLEAVNPNTLLVTGMRGAGKTFWWGALQDKGVRQWINKQAGQPMLQESTRVETGFGITPEPDKYPDKDELRNLIQADTEPRIIWRTVQAHLIAKEDHPIRCGSWEERVNYVNNNPGNIARLFYDRDRELNANGAYFLILFDALDRCADDWKGMYKLTRGLMQTALDIRSYSRLRVKIFLRTDQVDEFRIADFPDASKVLSSSVELRWPRHELYGLLWHNLANTSDGDVFRKFLTKDIWSPMTIGGQSLYAVPRQLAFQETHQREKFHGIAGQWMGTDPRRGFPYTWIPNHLADTEGRVSPRSFLAALQAAAKDTTNRWPEHKYALHYNSIKGGVQEASKIRVRELREDYPWVDRVLAPLERMVVPCEFEEIEERWQHRSVLSHLSREVENDAVKLPPSRLNEGASGVRQDLQSLGIFQRMNDGRVNIPDVFRVGYGLGRRGGVKAIR